tara:strand:+ start:668 stop:877 length:210 start_codon:yes stop_codon:yes gene_type:complete
MVKREFIIITCPKCRIKNRIKSYSPNKIPVCQKCRSELVGRDENEVFSRYGKAEESFQNLPGIGFRADK